MPAARWAAWVVMAATLAALFAIKPQLDALVDFEAGRVADRGRSGRGTGRICG